MGNVDLKFYDDYTGSSGVQTPTGGFENADVVFIGYGIEAPEYKWDDFKGVDVKGKTIVVLVNDPPVADSSGDGKTLDSRVFGVKAMTYYGR